MLRSANAAVPARLARLALPLAVLCGCGAAAGEGGSGAAAVPERSLAAVPEAVVHRCGQLAEGRAIVVLCPTRLPRARWFVRHRSLAPGEQQYLVDLQTRPPGSGDAFHALAGGRRGPWPLAAVRGRWPADTALPRDLGLLPHGELAPGEGPEDLVRGRLEVRSPVRVAGHPGLLLEPEGHPRGGVHGGHRVVIWNQAGDGYVLSLHAGEHGGAGEAEQDRALLRAAASMSRRPARAAPARRAARVER